MHTKQEISNMSSDAVLECVDFASNGGVRSIVNYYNEDGLYGGLPLGIKGSPWKFILLLVSPA